MAVSGLLLHEWVLSWGMLRYAVCWLCWSFRYEMRRLIVGGIYLKYVTILVKIHVPEWLWKHYIVPDTCSGYVKLTHYFRFFDIKDEKKAHISFHSRWFYFTLFSLRPCTTVLTVIDLSPDADRFPRKTNVDVNQICRRDLLVDEVQDPPKRIS